MEAIVNNAGRMLLGDISKQDSSEWKDMYAVNVIGVLNGMQAVLPSMIERKTGTIINISSIAGKKTFADHAAYVGTKFAVHSIKRARRSGEAQRPRHDDCPWRRRDRVVEPYDRRGDQSELHGLEALDRRRPRSENDSGDDLLCVQPAAECQYSRDCAGADETARVTSMTPGRMTGGLVLIRLYGMVSGQLFRDKESGQRSFHLKKESSQVSWLGNFLFQCKTNFVTMATAKSQTNAQGTRRLFPASA